MKPEVSCRIPLFLVDAFTDEQFKGNPAAVCLLHIDLEDNTLQSISAEMNLSETAFLQSAEKKPFVDSKVFSLRWFTPKVEVPLCGHATLAAAAVLFYEVGIPGVEVRFKTVSGDLNARKLENGILLDFPADEMHPITPDQRLLRALGTVDFVDAWFSEKSGRLLIRLRNEEAVRNLTPDFQKMTFRMEEEVRGVIVTSEASSQYDFVSRYFAPWVGINEDPVTGSAHTSLAPYWSKILGKNEMLAYQASPRGGELIVRISTDNRVDLIGKTVIVSKGKLYLLPKNV